MALHTKGRQEKEKKVSSVIDFATTLEHRLAHDPLPIGATDDLALPTHLTTTFPLPHCATLHTQRATLDRLGTVIWNHATRISRISSPQQTQNKRLLALTRAFAALLLDATTTAPATAPPAVEEEMEQGLRVLKVAIKAGRGCLEAEIKDGEGLLRVLECAAGWEARLKAAEDAGREVEAVEVARRARAEYWVLRTAHAWKRDRLDLAEHMFAKSGVEPSRLPADTAVLLADLLFEIGRGVFGRRRYEEAVKWLERAYGAVGERCLEELDHDAVELRLAVLNFLVRAYLRLGDVEAKGKAGEIVDMLERESGDKMAVQLLRIEVLTAADSELDVDKYYAVVSRMIREIDLSNANFKTVIHHIHKIKGKNAELAAKALDELLHTRLLTEANTEWIEKVVVTQIWIHVDSGGSLPAQWLRDLLDVVLQQSHPFEAPATHAAQTILWKRLEIAYSQGKYSEAESWCNIALHPLFDRAGESNKAKISRKLILCAVAQQEHNAARQVFFGMSETARNAPYTRYLMYKSAIRDGQSDFAAECLDVICRQSDKDATLLYACAMEALPMEDKRQTILALQKVLEKYEYGAPVGVHLPALLRCTIKLLIPYLGSTGENSENAMEELCKVFGGAAAQATKARRRHHEHDADTDLVFTDKEVEWFSRNSYNLSLKYCASAHPTYLLRLLDKCIQFIGLLPGAPKSAESGGSASTSSDLVLRLLLCHYLASCAAVVLARSTDSVPESLAAYATASKHANSFKSVATPYLRTPSHNSNPTPTPDLGAATRADLAAKRAQLLRYELESALRRSDWDGLDALWDESFDTPPHTNPATGTGNSTGDSWYTHHLSALADLALLTHATLTRLSPTSSPHRAPILSLLQRIINHTWQHAGAPAPLSRWLRCLFHLSLPHISNLTTDPDPDDTIPLQCLTQAATVIAAVGVPAYPQDEADWLAATAFNRAVDFYCEGDDGRARIWAEGAMGVAGAVERGGRKGGLAGVLRERWGALGLS